MSYSALNFEFRRVIRVSYFTGTYTKIYMTQANNKGFLSKSSWRYQILNSFWTEGKKRFSTDDGRMNNHTSQGSWELKTKRCTHPEHRNDLERVLKNVDI